MEEPFVVALGGRRWELPYLPFRVVKSVQPALFGAYADASKPGGSGLAEAQIDQLALATWQAIAHVDRGLAYEDFLSLPFSVTDLLAALPAIAQAAGQRTKR